MADTAASTKTAKAAKPARAAKAVKPAARKRAAAKASAAPTGRSRSTARAGAARAASTAGRTRGAGPRSTAPRGTVDLVGDYAERVVLIPVGVALLAREQVGDVIAAYGTPTKAQAQLRKFESRGGAARTRLEREVRKTRTRVERELRERRRELDRRRVRISKSVTAQVEQTQAQIEKTQSQIEGAVKARLDEGADIAGRLQERVLNLV
jgi:hypothetical protein